MEKDISTKTVIFQTESGALELQSDATQDTVWATQADLVRLYNKDQSVVSRHINSIFKDEEVDKKSNMQKMHIANSDKPVSFYSLDIILAVGYRTNSSQAINFRKWAAVSRADFVHKMAISSKEARETLYWSQLLEKSQFVTYNYKQHIQDCTELVKILTSIVKTTKN